jgi:hypothetical protein
MSRRAVLNAALSVVGAALLVWQVGDVGGIDAVRRGLASVGAGFLLVLVLSFLRFVMRAVAWRALLGQPAPLASAIAATLGGDALGNVTPFGLAASEPAKAFYLGRHIEPGRAFAALAAENFFYSVSVAIYVIGGAAALLAAFPDLPTAVRQGGIGALVLMAMLLVAAAWVAWARPSVMTGILRRVPAGRAARLAGRLRDLEQHTYGSATGAGARLGQVVTAQAAFHLLSFAELWLLLYLVTGGLSLPLEALVLDSVSRVINVVFKIVPMRLGVDEVSSEMVGVAVGLVPGHGLVLALVRKIRMIVWAAVGIALWTARR